MPTATATGAPSTATSTATATDRPQVIFSGAQAPEPSGQITDPPISNQTRIHRGEVPSAARGTSVRCPTRCSIFALPLLGGGSFVAVDMTTENPFRRISCGRKPGNHELAATAQPPTPARIGSWSRPPATRKTKPGCRFQAAAGSSLIISLAGGISAFPSLGGALAYLSPSPVRRRAESDFRICGEKNSWPASSNWTAILSSSKD